MTELCLCHTSMYTLQLVLILAIHQPKIVYDTLFEATWETLQQFRKQGSTNGNDSRFAHLGQQLICIPLTVIVPGGDGKKRAMEK
jgi:hypothetical protein